MAFEICLPETRIRECEGLWPNQLPIDDLDKAVRACPSREAFVGRNSASGEEIRLTYAELGAHVDRIAVGLLDLGVGKGDAVAFQLPNWWQLIAIFYACSRVGAVANPLMPIFRQRELRYMLAFSGAKVAVIPAHWRGCDHAAMLQELRADLPDLAHVLVVGGRERGSFEESCLTRAAPSSVELETLTKLRPSPNDVVELIYTSGTSGEPKAVMHTANTVRTAAQSFIDEIPLSSNDVVFMGSPYAHQTGFLYGILMPVMLATKTVALDIWSALEAAPLVEREGATFSMGSTPSFRTSSTCRRSDGQG